MVNMPSTSAVQAIDPTLDFLQSFNMSTSSSSSSPHSLGDRDEGPRDEDDFEPLTLNPSHVAPGGLMFHSLQIFGQMLKGRKDFSEQTEAEFDAFCSLVSPDDHVILANKKADKWSVSDELKESARIYSRVFILLPTTVAYCGNVPKHIMPAMRDLKVDDMPPIKEVARLNLLCKLIDKFLTDCHNAVKEKIKNSLSVDSPTCNIADLTHAVISNTPVQPTLQLYMRMAFLRWCYVQYAHIVPDDGWWLMVDETIENFRTKLKDEYKISQTFNNLYQKDKLEYGNPADSSHQVIKPKDIVSWQSTVNMQAAQVQGKTKKRRHVD
ncbi:hypothetical protein K443DRAFT_131972 [Laccaria amethystina LaAM-08-1]|uniref:Uncharacterized protein n=1 Tax=Laccaria amethystina LaAM-08-1 TaxID=1095629 RepID=A0A0C9XB52_9AGAR|nr:hypothetical protein K443DRAFT_131972 [Laccaria amethystina LaAM-08-1]